jgi:ornithine cyclodeaminase/alanine dehydrogenase-like protein (mu-crystallin family)
MADPGDKHLKTLKVIDREAVARHLPRAVCFDLAARAFRETSARRTNQPNRLIVPVGNEQGGVLSVMAGVMHRPVLFGAKISAVYPENRHRGLPGHQGLVVLFDPDTGASHGRFERRRNYSTPHGSSDRGRHCRPCAPRRESSRTHWGR